jgi:molybdate transport system ATP-binding protein
MILIDVKKELLGACGEMLLDISLEIEDGEFLVIRGDSGGGKSTFLRILAGLESASGNIRVDGDIWLSNNRFLPPQKREIGFVFQDYALFPNMSVEQNLLFVTKDKELAKYLLEITELLTLKDRYPDSLSGGQQQRVAICRALMRRPKLLLMDEPLSALDPNMRLKLQEQILTLHKEFKTTTVMVSHDLAEIYRLADRVVVMGSGKILDITTPNSILSNRLEFRGKVLSLDDKRGAVISIGKNLVNVFLRDNLNISTGDEVMISVDSLSLEVQKPL